MHGARNAGIEGMNGAQNLKRPVGIGDGCVDERCLVGAALALGVARSRVPGGGNDGLVVLDGLAFDLDPMAERAARSLVPSESAAGFLPGVGVPFGGVADGDLAMGHVGVEIVDPLF